MKALLSTFQLINHMVNHMCHFPMGWGASRLSSSIQEHHDMEELEVNDLKQEIFYSSNIQVENMYNDKQNYMLVTVLNIAFIADP